MEKQRAPSPELRHLRYFIAVAEAGTFTGAAARLGMQQPPLSQQIGALEKSLGFLLFHRRPKGVELTRGGRVFLDEARRIVDRMSLASNRAMRAARGEDGVLRLGVTSSAAVHPVVPDILRASRAAYPGLLIEVQHGNTPELSAAVEKDQLDAAIVRTPLRHPVRLALHTIASEEVLAVLAADHPLAREAQARRAAGVTLREIAGQSLILVRRPDEQGVYADLITACRHAGCDPVVGAVVSNMLTAVMLVAGGMGVSVVPASMRGIQADRVVMLPLRGARRITAPITVVYRGDDDNPVTRRFLDRVRATGSATDSAGPGDAREAAPAPSRQRASGRAPRRA